MKDLSPNVSCCFPYVAFVLLCLTKMNFLPEIAFVIFAIVLALYFFPGKLFLKREEKQKTLFRRIVLNIAYFTYMSALALSVLQMFISNNMFVSMYSLFVVVYLLSMFFICNKKNTPKTEIITYIGFYIFQAACFIGW